MKYKVLKKLLSLCLLGAVTVTTIGAACVDASAGANGVVIEEAEVNQLLTKDLKLPDKIDSRPDAEISYSVGDADSNYVSVDGTTLKVTRPYAGKGNYSFTLTATITENGEETTQKFPLTIAEGVSDDTYAGYVYACFGNVDGYDVQQLHLFLSEDGLNWTALNGFHPIFETGTDYADNIVKAGTHNYRVAEGTNVSETTSGDASVLFPFEGDDQGIRDPYIIRGCREEDSDKVWILATDLNTMASKYGGNLDNHVVGNWGTMSTAGSTKLFIYETEDWVHWERRYVDVGAEIGAGAAWAPEAIYNPEKDNYLVYWSCRVNVDGYNRNRLYCNETKDFKTFGPTKMYEQEPFYQNWSQWASDGKTHDGFGNIDTSQLWVAEGDNPYGTLYRLVKDESNNHIELMSAETVLDPDVDYDTSNPVNITPYTLGGTTYSNANDLSGLSYYQRAEVAWNWFKNESTGNHFQYISQKNMEARAGAYEGATMFKFNDRDEWCIMIDYYGNMNVRYEPYTTIDLSKEESITKVTSDYGRTGGDVGCHGGMIPVTAAEYNQLIDAYNADPTISNYHKIDYISCDTRELEDVIASMKEKLDSLSGTEKKNLEDTIARGEAMLGDSEVSSEEMNQVIEHMKEIADPQTVIISEEDQDIILKSGESKTVTATAKDQEITWKSADETVATVENGTIKATGEGSTFVFAKAGRQGIAVIRVEVKAN